MMYNRKVYFLFLFLEGYTVKDNISWADEQKSGQAWLRREKFWSVVTVALIPIMLILLYLEMSHYHISRWLGF
jgi:hypothetical protein